MKKDWGDWGWRLSVVIVGVKIVIVIIMINAHDFDIQQHHHLQRITSLSSSVKLVKQGLVVLWPVPVTCDV